MGRRGTIWIKDDNGTSRYATRARQRTSFRQREAHPAAVQPPGQAISFHRARPVISADRPIEKPKQTKPT